MYDDVVKMLTFAISSPDEFLVCDRLTQRQTEIIICQMLLMRWADNFAVEKSGIISLSVVVIH